MDSLKSLLDAKKYDLVLKLTQGSADKNDLFYRIAAYIGLAQYENALYVIQDHQAILEANLVALIPAHIELLCVLQRFEQAQAILEYYSNLPYQSQAVEEILRKMPEVIKKEEEKDQAIYISEDKLSEYLASDDNELVLFGLDILKKRDIFTFLPDVVKIMTTHKSQSIRSLALILLVDKEVDRELPFLSLEGVNMVNPKKLLPPFRGDNFNKILKKIDSEAHDLTISQTALQIFSSYCIYIYPNQINGDVDELALALYVTSKKYLGDLSIDIYIEASKREQDSSKVVNYFNLINKALSDI